VYMRYATPCNVSTAILSPQLSAADDMNPPRLTARFSGSG
jgi:hypothetical protein